MLALPRGSEERTLNVGDERHSGQPSGAEFDGCEVERDYVQLVVADDRLGTWTVKTRPLVRSKRDDPASDTGVGTAIVLEARIGPVTMKNPSCSSSSEDSTGQCAPKKTLTAHQIGDAGPNSATPIRHKRR